MTDEQKGEVRDDNRASTEDDAADEKAAPKGPPKGPPKGSAEDALRKLKDWDDTGGDAPVATKEEDAPAAPKVDAPAAPKVDAPATPKEDAPAAAEEVPVVDVATDADEEIAEDEGEPTARIDARIAMGLDLHPIISNEQAIEEIFGSNGQETDPGDPHASEYFDPELDEPVRNQTSPKPLLFTLVGVVVIVGVGFALLSADLRRDAVRMLQGHDIIEEREMRERARLEEERRQMLEAAPKFGTIEIITDPNNLLVTSPGQPAMVFPGSRVDITYPTRSKVMFQDISVTEDFVFTIHGEGAFQDKTYTVPAFGQPDSPWVQSYTGDYTASATFGLCWSGEPARVDEKFCIYPSTEPEWLARELRWRMDWRPDPEADGETMPTRLLGSVTVTSDPPAALIAFNGRQLVNEESQEPHRTPFTFSTYNAALDVEDRTPAEVYLSREGLPLTVLYEGKVTAMMGVYLHQFQCTLRSGAEPPPPAPAPTPEQIAGTEPMPEPPSWLNLCDYTYSVHLELQDPPPPEGSGEGSGEAPADAAAQATP